MANDRQRLSRLHRLERVRAIAKDAAAAEAAQAEGTLAQLVALADKVTLLATDYAARDDAPDALALQQLVRFSGGLRQVSVSTRHDAGQARAVADRKQSDHAHAERRRAAVEERALDEARAIAARRIAPAIGARRATGTGLE